MSERKGTKALELWCKRLVKDYPNVQIENMTTSWRNGIAFCALVHHFRPELIDLSALKPEDVYYNNELAFRIAEQELGIPSLLDPEDMVDNAVPDRLSVLTYLSQFYQRLGQTGVSKAADNFSKLSPPASPKQKQEKPAIVPVKPGRSYENCTSCGLPVYLAQRLLISHKLYHRRCFRCSNCDGLLSPSNCYENLNSTQFCCDSCQKDDSTSTFLIDDDHRMGMLMCDDYQEEKQIAPVVKATTKPRKTTSVLDTINIFEKNLHLTSNQNIESKSHKEFYKSENRRSIDSPLTAPAVNSIQTENKVQLFEVDQSDTICAQDINMESVTGIKSTIPYDIDFETTDPIVSPYKTDISKYNFLQTQLTTDDKADAKSNIKDEIEKTELRSELPDITKLDKVSSLQNSETCVESYSKDVAAETVYEGNETTNITDDSRIAESNDLHKQSSHLYDIEDSKSSKCLESKQADETPRIIPPRRKNLLHKKAEKEKTTTQKDIKQEIPTNPPPAPAVCYPDDLNPFGDDDDASEEDQVTKTKHESTNPFGSSDDEESEPVSQGQLGSKTLPSSANNQQQGKRLIVAQNPFWSDGEEPSSDEEKDVNSLSNSKMFGKTGITSSTPNLPSLTPRRKKAKAPRPPVITVREAPEEAGFTCSMDDVASLSSVSSHCSTINSDMQHAKLTPTPRKKRPAPTPPDSISTVSTGSRDVHYTSMTSKEMSFDTAESLKPPEVGTWRRVKGPAPGLPLPGRRMVRPQITTTDLQVQLDLLETQQLGLERQGVLIEQMIRDKCEGDEVSETPQEEVEDLVIQLCELVNEKNDLFRKQTELMYTRRQQRLEQEQADIEHEIRVIQSRPAVNRIDADKAREEFLVGRLVAVVRLRDELVQQLDSERRRERQEDAAIALSIAQRRASRNSDSMNSSLQSVEVVKTPKKSKVKDRVKKQLRKAKNTLNIKKKDDDGHSKDKDGKTKWFQSSNTQNTG